MNEAKTGTRGRRIKDETPQTNTPIIVNGVDIMPSIIDLLGVTLQDRLLVGQSVFDTSTPGRAYNYTGHSYWYLDANVFIEMAPPALIRTFTHHLTFDIKAVPGTEPAFANALGNLQSVVHYLNEGLNGNSLYKWKSSL